MPTKTAPKTTATVDLDEPEFGRVRTLWRYPIWSTRRVVINTTAVIMIGSNPKTIMAIVIWTQTTVMDWVHTAQAVGMFGGAA